MTQTLQDCPAGLPGAVPRAQDYLYRPKPQFWGFDNRDPILSVGRFHVSFQVFTVGPNENSYGLATDHVTVTSQDGGFQIKASSFASAGQQALFPGQLEARFTPCIGGLRVNIQATSGEPIRAVKMRLHHLPAGTVHQTGWNIDPNGLPITEQGANYIYPEYQGGMPAWLLDLDGSKSIGIVSTDSQPRPKRLTAYRTPEGCIAEITFEEDARHFDHSIHVPDWEILQDATLEQVIARREQILEAEAGMVSWERRSDVPDWAREIKLVITLHGMHWSGYVFNDYARMLKIVDWVTKRIPGSEVLVFLAAWEGRYYRMYGSSEADERMGGVPGLKDLVDGIHKRGSHVMPMFSGNYPQPGTENYNEYAPHSQFDSSSGFRWDPMRGYVVDWGQLRGTGMQGGGPALNPGAPGWRNHLTRQVAQLNQRYGFDGSYFDTQPSADNDAHYSPLEGLRQITTDLRADKKDLLIATESWFDLSLPLVPWSQTPDGPNQWTRRYQRRFAHLSMGEPSRGSTGVHELGHIPYDRTELNRMFDIPTVAFVDGTLESATPEIESVIREAHSRRG